jgi:branched-chain amino acid transport system permease protein
MQPYGSNPDMNKFNQILDRLNLSPLGLTALIFLAILPLIPPFNQEYLIRWLVAAAMMGAAAIAFDFTAGFINIVNFGFYAILGLGGYTSSILALNLGLTPWIGIFLGAVASGILGFLTGLLTLRLRGIFAAVMAWFVGLALMGLATKLIWLTRGPLGLATPQLFKTSSNLPYYYLILVLMLGIYLICKGVTRSKIGVAFKAIGQNMEAARTSGINPTYYRIYNFTMSCTLAGFLGGFYAHYYGILTPDVMHTSKTVEVLAVAYIGGRGSLWGGATVAFPFLLVMELVRSSLSQLPGLNLVIYGFLLILVMIYYPGGFAAFFNLYSSKAKNRALRYFLSGRLERTKS